MKFTSSSSQNKKRSWCFFIDYQRLNAVIRQDAYPLPRINDSLDALIGTGYFSMKLEKQLLASPLEC